MTRYCVVPVEPTMEMIVALDTDDQDKYVGRGRGIDCYKTMLTARPALDAEMQEAVVLAKRTMGLVAQGAHLSIAQTNLAVALLRAVGEK